MIVGCDYVSSWLYQKFDCCEMPIFTGGVESRNALNNEQWGFTTFCLDFLKWSCLSLYNIHF